MALSTNQRAGLPANWAASAHAADGIIWKQGPGVLAKDPTPPAILNTYPVRTMLNAPGTNVTTYYETDFTFSGNLAERLRTLDWPHRR